MATKQSSLMTTTPAPKKATTAEERAQKLYGGSIHGANITRAPVTSKRVHQAGADPKRKAVRAKGTFTK